jgi:hypothetical protein
VLALDVFGAAAAPGLLALHSSIFGRGLVPMLATSVLVSFDLDRPTRGLIKVPSTPLASVRASMALPPAAQAPTRAATGGTLVTGRPVGQSRVRR